MKSNVVLFAVYFAFFIAINPIFASTENLKVQAGKMEKLHIELKEGDKFFGEIIVSGNLDVHFYIAYPNNNIFMDFNKISNQKIEFTVPTDGEFTFVFDNSQSDLEKTLYLIIMCSITFLGFHKNFFSSV